MHGLLAEVALFARADQSGNTREGEERNTLRELCWAAPGANVQSKTCG